MSEKGIPDPLQGWSFKLSLGPQRQSGSSLGQRKWIFGQCTAFSLDANTVLVRNQRTGAFGPVTREVLQALQACSQFRTLEGHAQHIARTIPAYTSRQAEVRQVLDLASRKGILLPNDGLLATASHQDLGFNPPRLEHVMIRTCDRPRPLERLLESFQENEQTHGHRYQYHVFDDSRQTENRQANEAIIEAMSGSGRLAVAYLGETAHRELVQRLEDAFPGHVSALRFLLGDHRYSTVSPGRLNNHILLRFVGHRIVLADDDMVCQPRTVRATVRAVKVSGRDRGTHFFRDYQAALDSTKVLDVDPIDEHGRMLGRSLLQALRFLGSAIPRHSALDDLGPGELPGVTADSQVLTTSNGILGDPGTARHAWLYSMDPESRARFITTEEDYQRSRVQRHMVRVHDDYHFHTSTSLMTTTLTGVDNQTLLPPVFPDFRNEDGLFGEMLRFLFPQSLRFEFPWTLSHFPEPSRVWPDSLLDEPKPITVAGFVKDLAAKTMLATHAEAPGARLEYLGQCLIDLSQSSAASLEMLLRDYQTGLHAVENAALRAQLQGFPEAPAYWKRDVSRLINANQQAMVTLAPGIFSPQELDCPLDGQMRQLRAMLELFGEVCMIWPKLCERARTDIAASAPA